MNTYQEIHATDNNGYPYLTISNDENQVRIYTLNNGLKVFLAQNFDAPRIQTYIPVRTGSNNDPKDNTGLAHYLEHMMFKGTSKIGTKDWQKEKVLLDQISELFEQHKAEQDPEKKKAIYKEIDALSLEASQYAIANEYDKCISTLGATGTNAHTWFDETVYKNNIPNNELEKWLKIERERFSEIALRLFHTELESVYEEFNRAQDNDGRLVQYALMELLFPTHPNGQQTTLGKAEHLKNPSMKAIHQYFSDYYVPNNYAMVLVGDLDFEETIRLIDQYFGTFQYKALPEKDLIEETPITQIQKRVVKSPTIPRVQIAWRTDSYGTRENILADVVANILSNKGEAGLIDLNICNAQKALYAAAFSMGLNQYGYFSAVIVPKEEQSLDDGIGLLLAEIDNIKQGNFPDWLLPAIINDFKLQRLKGLETADGLATNLYQTYIRKKTWKEELEEMDIYQSITKEEVIAFANDFFKENYVAVYKERGENDNLIRVENPEITPVKINREEQSDFLKAIAEEQPKKDIEPQFINYQKEIKTTEIKGKKLSFVKNKYNAIAQLHYIFPLGTDHDKALTLAISMMEYLGTPQFSTEELKQEFYKLSITPEFSVEKNMLSLSLTGLEENMKEGIRLLHHWMKNAVPQQEIYEEFVQTILESRAAAKRDKGKIMQALQAYAKFGKASRLRDVLTETELQNIQCQDLTDKMSSLFDYPYELFFYGEDEQHFKEYIGDFISEATLETPERKQYPHPETKGKVYFVHYDMVQTEMVKIGRGEAVKNYDFGKINVFNEYFGTGLSSVVFQEIRESKSLAYSAYVVYRSGAEMGEPDYVTTYLGTQPDKLKIAVDTMAELMAELPQYPTQFENAKRSALKQIASGRITRTNIFFNHLKLKRIGVEGDVRQGMYEEIKHLDLPKLSQFYNETIQPIDFNIALLGNRENLDIESLSKLGEVQELSLEEIFGF